MTKRKLFRLVQYHYQPLVRCAGRYGGGADSRDIVHEVLVKLLTTRSYVGVLGKDESLKCWLFAVVSNQAKNYHRRAHFVPLEALDSGLQNQFDN